MIDIFDRQKYIYTAYIEMLESWVTAEDLDTFENVAKESASFVAGLVRYSRSITILTSVLTYR